MSSLHFFVCSFLLFLSTPSLIRGDEIFDKINAVFEEKFNTSVSHLVEQTNQKEQRILNLERTNLELTSEVQGRMFL